MTVCSPEDRLHPRDRSVGNSRSLEYRLFFGLQVFLFAAHLAELDGRSEFRQGPVMRNGSVGFRGDRVEGGLS